MTPSFPTLRLFDLRRRKWRKIVHQREDDAEGVGNGVGPIRVNTIISLGAIVMTCRGPKPSYTQYNTT